MRNSKRVKDFPHLQMPLQITSGRNIIVKLTGPQIIKTGQFSVFNKNFHAFVFLFLTLDQYHLFDLSTLRACVKTHCQQQLFVMLILFRHFDAHCQCIHTVKHP